MERKARIDGREATRVARDYFTEVHGQLGLMGFRVLEVKYDEAKPEWLVRCSFYPMPGVWELHYEVQVSDSGEILGVTMVEPKPAESP